MRFLYHGKDGGAESTVWGLWLFELKRLASIVLLRFEDGTRDAYHTHAFGSVSWVLRGELHEQFLGGPGRSHRPSLRPILTRRDDFHQVRSVGRTWVLSLRGPWRDWWHEWTRDRGLTTLTHGRRELPR
jgi:hypothetical protein